MYKFLLSLGAEAHDANIVDSANQNLGIDHKSTQSAHNTKIDPKLVEQIKGELSTVKSENHETSTTNLTACIKTYFVSKDNLLMSNIEKLIANKAEDILIGQGNSFTKEINELNPAETQKYLIDLFKKGIDVLNSMKNSDNYKHLISSPSLIMKLTNNKGINSEEAKTIIINFFTEIVDAASMYGSGGASCFDGFNTKLQVFLF